MLQSTFIFAAVCATTLYAAPILDGLGGATGGVAGGATDPLGSLPAGQLLGGSGGLFGGLGLENILSALPTKDLIHCDKTLKLLRIQVDIGIPLASKPEDNNPSNPLPTLPTGLPTLPTGLPTLPTGLPNLPSGNPIDNLPVPTPSVPIPTPSNPLGGILGKK